MSYVISLIVTLLLLSSTSVSSQAACRASDGKSYNFFPDYACSCQERIDYSRNPPSHDNFHACQPDQYCNTTDAMKGCKPRIPENQPCPVSWGLGNISAYPCQAGLVCSSDPRAPTTMGGICKRPCGSAPTIATASLPNGTVGLAYSLQLQTSGGQGAVGLSLASGSSLPSGLSLNNGAITGTPRNAGTFSFTVNASDSCGTGAQTGSKRFTMTVANPAPACAAPPTIATASPLPNAPVNQGYSKQLQHSGGAGTVTYRIVQGNLPAPLALNGSGLISGTPTAQGTYNFTVETADTCSAGAQRRQKQFTLVVTAPSQCTGNNALSMVDQTPGEAATRLNAGRNGNRAIQAYGGFGPVTFSQVGGTLPPGMSLNPAGTRSGSNPQFAFGTISGTPSTPGIYRFSMKAADSCGATPQKDYSITVIGREGCEIKIDNVSAVGTLVNGLNVTIQYHNDRAGSCCAKVGARLKGGPYNSDIANTTIDAGPTPPGQPKSFTINFPFAKWTDAKTYSVWVNTYLDPNSAGVCNYSSSYTTNPDGVRADAFRNDMNIPPPPARLPDQGGSPAMRVR